MFRAYNTLTRSNKANKTKDLTAWMTIKEVKKIDTDKRRNMCIKNNWYTRGTTSDYNNMFKMCQRDNITVNQLYRIAKDIYEHTNVDTAEQGCSREYSDNENILNMMI